MPASVERRWNASPGAGLDVGRRHVLLLSAAAAAAVIAASPGLRPVGALVDAVDPPGALAALPKSGWDWWVELAVLRLLPADRAGAIALLEAALAVDLDPRSTWRRKRALRLYDLRAALARPADRADLAAFVEARSSDPALRARAQRWRDLAHAARPRLWRTTLPGGVPLSIRLGPA